jgi:hypothetical protein
MDDYITGTKPDPSPNKSVIADVLGVCLGLTDAV